MKIPTMFRPSSLQEPQCPVELLGVLQTHHKSRWGTAALPWGLAGGPAACPLCAAPLGKGWSQEPVLGSSGPFWRGRWQGLWGQHSAAGRRQREGELWVQHPGRPLPRHWQPNPHEGMGKGDVQSHATICRGSLSPRAPGKGPCKQDVSHLCLGSFIGEETPATPATPSHPATCPLLPSISVQPTAKCDPQSPSPSLSQQQEEGNSQPGGVECLPGRQGPWA